jgi:hypothetical protein
MPRITAEHPAQVIVAYAPGDRRRRAAALKRWVEDDGYVMANVYLPDAVHKFRSVEKVRPGQNIQYARRVDDPGGFNALREVPLVEARNNPSMRAGGQSDLDTAIPLQDAVNKLVCDMLVASEYAAFPQRVLIGIDVPRDENNPAIARRDVEATFSLQRLIALTSDKASIDQFQAADLKNYVTAIEPLITHLAAQTRTPPHYLLGQISNASGDALKAAETGLVARVHDKMTFFGEAHEDMMRLAFRATGDTERAAALDAETLWRDPESRSFGELVDGLVKLSTIGVPEEILWERAGFSPQEITRMKGMKVAEDLLAPPPPAPPPAPPPPAGT